MGNDLTDEQWEQIDNALYAGRKIDAIKVFREVAGCGLKESKDFIDDYEKQLREKFPDRFSKAANKTGCLVMMLALLGSICICLTIKAF